MPRGEDQTTIALLSNEKQALEEAKCYYEQANNRRISTGEFVKFLAEQYLGEQGQRGLMQAHEARPVEAIAVPPGQMSYTVNCPVCSGVISWPVGLPSGHCPYCHDFLTYG